MTNSAPHAAILECFLPHLSVLTRDQIRDPEALASRLEALLAEGCAAWPGVEVEPAAFLRFLASKLPGGDPLEAVAGLASNDLYLACACLDGDARALAAFETAHFPMVEAALARLHASPRQVDEVKQLLREQLFVGVSTGKPTLGGYSGRGALGGWVRVTAVRAALRIITREQQQISREPDLLDALPAGGGDPELEHLKVRYRLEFRAAFEEAVRGLGRRERNLLRYHHLDGLTVDDIGALYRVHRATAARWVAKAREEVLRRTRDALTARLRVGRAEYDSIMRLIQSQLHLSLSAILPGGREEEELADLESEQPEPLKE